MPENLVRRFSAMLIRNQYRSFRFPLRQRGFFHHVQQIHRQAVTRAHRRIRRLYDEYEEAENQRINACLMAVGVTFIFMLSQLFSINTVHPLSILINKLVILIYFLVTDFLVRKIFQRSSEQEDIQRKIRHSWNRVKRMQVYKTIFRSVNIRRIVSSSLVPQMLLSLEINRASMFFRRPLISHLSEPSRTGTSVEQVAENQVLEYVSPLNIADESQGNVEVVSSSELHHGNGNCNMTENITGRSSLLLGSNVFRMFLRHINSLSRSYRDVVLRSAIYELNERSMLYYRDGMIHITDPRTFYDFIQREWDFTNSFLPRPVRSAVGELGSLISYPDESILSAYSTDQEQYISDRNTHNSMIIVIIVVILFVAAEANFNTDRKRFSGFIQRKRDSSHLF